MQQYGRKLEAAAGDDSPAREISAAQLKEALAASNIYVFCQDPELRYTSVFAPRASADGLTGRP